MKNLLESFATLPDAFIWLIFLIENLLLTATVLIVGRFIQNRFNPQSITPYAHTRKEWLLCAITNALNTIVTYAGYWLWKHDFLHITYETSYVIAIDFLLMFIAMDFFMYLFHIIIHKTFLYKAIHQLHHRAIHPKPIDLFILHPLETMGFGTLWLVLLLLHPFNIYAIVIYLTVNLIFGLTGHLGIEPIPASIRRLPVIAYLGTSTFHHDHHETLHHNFGFYTSLWDRLFGTLKQ